MALLHFITGKGGVGKSSVAAALVKKLSADDQGPILLLEVQGSGRSLQLCGLNGPKPFENTPLPGVAGAYGARLLPKETFRQYFSLLLTLGNDQSSFATATSGLRDRLVDIVVDNKIVSAFIDVCPGLEPAVLLGKLHWEASQGQPPESSTGWKHVVVDAPATGHGLMLFKSTHALTEVFGAGTIFRQASEIMSFIRDPARTRIYVVSTPEELPLRETLDIREGLQRMSIRPARYFLNRTHPFSSEAHPERCSDPVWAREVEFEKENNADQDRLSAEFRTRIGSEADVIALPEIYSDDPVRIADAIAQDIPR